MSEVFEELAPAQALADSSSSPSAGALLRRARESAGLHIAALAVSLKVPVKKLEALEADRLDLLPDAVFVRALASSVCRTLKIDPADILQRLPQTSAPKLVYQNVGINAPFRAPSDGPGPSIWSQISRPAVLAGLVFLLIALVLILLPAAQFPAASSRSAIQSAFPDEIVDAAKGVTSTTVESPAVAQPIIAKRSNEGVPLMAPPLNQQAVIAPMVLSAVTTPIAPQAPPLQVPLAQPAPPVTVGAIAEANAKPSASAADAITASTSGLVVFTARDASWVEVTDARRSVILRRMLQPGEVVGASGALPLSAVVGRADATQVQIRGKTFDLSTVARDNVARFEVK